MGVYIRYLRDKENHYKAFFQTLDILNAGNRIITLKRNPNMHNKTSEQC